MSRTPAILLLLAVLAACDAEQLTDFEVNRFLQKEEGPKVSGVEQTLLASAKAAEAQGNFALARQYYQQLLDRSPDRVDYAYGLAESLRRSGELSGAMELYTQMLSRNPNDINAHEGQGMIYLSRVDMEAAARSFGEVMKHDPGRWRTLNAIGVLFSAKKMYAESMQYFNAALARAPNQPTVLNNMGLVAALDQDSFTAINKLEKAAAAAVTDDQRRRIAMNTALVHAATGDVKKAEAVARVYLTGAQLSNNLGLYAHIAKDDALAKSYLNMALTESKIYYERAWENLQNVQTAGEPAGTEKHLSTP